MSVKVIRFAPGLRPVIKHQEHDQSTHGSWANSSERSAKEIEVQQRITQIEHKSYPTDEDGMSSNRVTAIYETKDGTKIKLLHDNEKTSDGDISMTTKAYLFVDGGVKEIADLESSRANNVVPEAGAIIDRIQVQPEYKRQGIATAMLNFARSYSQDGIKIEHSFSLTDDAKGWSGVVKHQEHDQKTHGNWATGISSELETWNPKDPVPASPRNATGTTDKFWENWEHGVDGDQFVDLYRQYAGEMLGLPVPKSSKDVGGSENYLTQRGFGASSTSAVRNQTEAVLTAIANGRPQPTLYRGMAGSDAESKALLEQFTNLKEGDTIDMPLVSTTRSLGVAQWYAADRAYTPSDTKVILKIQEGAKGVSVKREKSFYPSDFETITSGKFQVVGISTVTTPYWARGAVSARTFNLSRPGEDRVTGYRIQDPKNLSWDRIESDDPAAKVRYDIIRDGAITGNFSKIETSTVKYTNDRQTRPIKDGQDITVNSWTRKEPTTFTVIEVKLVEPHVLKKGTEFGMIFHNLFNTIPFIRDEEDVIKHQEHDQSSHGNWATGQKGGSGLSHREMFELKKQPDPLVSKVYAAEEKNHNQIQDKNADMPSAPNRTQFTNYADYDEAYKQYSKDFTAWSKKVTTSLISPLGQKHLDGTPRGVNGYVRDVLRQDWFVEAFGKGGVAGNNLEVKVSSANEAGAYQIGFKGDLPVSILRVSRGYSKAEPTIVHEIAHYATTISATSPHGGHGVEFARNHIFITSKLFGASFADGLEKSYREAGVPLGD